MGTGWNGNRHRRTSWSHMARLSTPSTGGPGLGVRVRSGRGDGGCITMRGLMIAILLLCLLVSCGVGDRGVFSWREIIKDKMAYNFF